MYVFPSICLCELAKAKTSHNAVHTHTPASEYGASCQQAMNNMITFTLANR